MASKFILSIALLAAAVAVSAVPVEYQQHQPEHIVKYQPQQVPAHYSHGHVKSIEHDVPAEYDFSYAVHDEHTGDIKSQQESRKGDVVHGRYELIDADGYKRIVEYTADEHTGFNAVVHREPTDVKIPVHKVASIAPVAHYQHAAPVAHYQHSAPVAHYQHSAPVAHYQAPVTVKQVKVPAASHFSHYDSGNSHFGSSGSQQHYESAPVVKVAPAPVAKVHHTNEPAHVTFNGPHNNYHY